MRREALSRFGGVSANTYVCHPWCGAAAEGTLWEELSIDFWGEAGRGHAINALTGELLLDWLMERPGPPAIRHTIFRHGLWTSFGGHSVWTDNDHSGVLRHVHVTYWP